LPPARRFPPDQRRRVLDRVMTAITSRKHLNKRRECTCPRVVKRARHNSYRVKKPGQHSIRHDAPATIKLVNHALNRERSAPQHDQNRSALDLAEPVWGQYSFLKAK
jgi:hypothetical protein